MCVLNLRFLRKFVTLEPTAFIMFLRKVVEHVCLLKAKEDLSEKDEKDMLDFLYTCQYQMRGIVAISVGECALIFFISNLCVCVCVFMKPVSLSQVV